MLGHKNLGNAVAFAPDGKMLATGGCDGTIRLWDPESGKESQVLEVGTSSRIFSLAFSPDGKRLVIAAEDGQTFLWDILKRKAKPLDEVITITLKVLFSHNGEWIAAGGVVEKDNKRMGIIRLFDARTGRLVRTWDDAVPSAISFSPDSRTLAVGHTDKTVKLWPVKPPSEDNKPDARVPKNRADTIEEERKRFEGTWQFASYEVDGKKLTKADVENIVRLKLKGKLQEEEGRPVYIRDVGNVHIVYDGEGKWKLQTADGTTVEEGSSALDPTKKPKAIDSMGTIAGTKQIQTKRGVYEFVNEDTCRVCLAASGQERPADFTAKPESGKTLWVLQRVKSEKEDKDAPTLRSDERLVAKKIQVAIFRRRITKILDELEAAKDEKAVREALNELQSTEDRLTAILSKDLVLKVYPAGDLVGKDAKSLIQLITKTIEPPSWSEKGGKGTIAYFPEGKVLIVSQTADIHNRVQAILDGLRK